MPIRIASAIIAIVVLPTACRSGTHPTRTPPMGSAALTPSVPVMFVGGPLDGTNQDVQPRDITPLCLVPGGMAPRSASDQDAEVVVGAGTLARTSTKALAAAGLAIPTTVCGVKP